MKRYLLVLLILLTAGLLLYRHCIREKGKIFVLFVVDTLRYETFWDIAESGYPGSGFAMLKEKCRPLHNAYSTSPWTLPSFYSLFTSMPAYALPPATSGEPGRLPFFTDILREEGIHTAGVGTSPYFNPFFGFDGHFDIFLNLTKGQGQNNSRRKIAPNTFFKSMASAEEIKTAVKETLSSISGEKDIFLFIHFIDPHIPYLPSGSRLEDFLGDEELGEFFLPDNLSRLRDMSREFSEETHERIRNLYKECVRDVDRETGEIISWIESRFNDRDIAYLLTSDHGEEFWEHGGFEHGHSFFNEVVRIPFVLTCTPPDASKPVDLTVIGGIVCDYFGLKPYENNPGDIVISSNLYGEPGMAIISHPYKLINHKGIFLFDLEVDGEEKHPLEKSPFYEVLAEKSSQLLEKSGKMKFENIDEDLRQELKSLGYIQ